MYERLPKNVIMIYFIHLVSLTDIFFTVAYENKSEWFVF